MSGSIACETLARMRHIGSIQDGALAARFGDYLTALGVGNDVEQGASGFNVWVHDDDHLDRAKIELNAFQTDPTADRYQQASKAADRIRADDEKRQRSLRRNYVDVRTTWSGAFAGRPPVLTMLLVIASCSITLMANFADRRKPLTDYLWIDAPSPHESLMRDIFRKWDRRPLQDVRRGQVWRLISPIFLHLDWPHLIFNMLWLADLGAIIERRKGTAWLALVVLSTALASNLVQYWWDGPHGAGMSGVVYALFGYVWMKGKFQPQEGMAVGQQTVLIMIAWLFVCMTGLLGPIGNAAHVVGLLGGMALGHAQYSWKRVKEMMKR